MFPRRTKRRILVSRARLVRRYSCYATERLVMSFRLAFPRLCLSLKNKRKKKKRRKERKRNERSWLERNVNLAFYPRFTRLIRGNATFRNGGKCFCYSWQVFRCICINAHDSLLRTLLRSWSTITMKPRFIYSSICFRAWIIAISLL